MSTSHVPQQEGTPSLGRTGFFSRVLAWLCVVTAVGAAGIALLFTRGIWLRTDLTREAQFAILAIWIASVCALIWGLYNGRASFAGLARGELFARRTIAGLRNLALGIFLFKCASFLLLVGITLVTRVPENAEISFRDLSEGAFTLISLGSIVMIASVMTRAAEIAEDHAQIV